MAHVTADRVSDTATTTGTSDFTVANSPATGFRTLNDVLSTNDTFFYAIAHRTSTEWETGLGTYSGSHVFVRTQVLNSSNSNSAVSFSAGTKDVFIDAPAARQPLWLVNAQTGTTYTIVVGDFGKLLTTSNASAVAVTLPQATTTFGLGWHIYAHNKGAGAVTITPTTSTINGAATLVLATGQGAMIVSDGTNYQVSNGLYLPIAGGTLTGLLTLSGAPTTGLHAATKTYVDTSNISNYLFLA